MAMVDQNFRNELVVNPKTAIEKVSGKELPEGFNIKVIESDPAYSATFVLPDFIGEAVEAGDEFLENVAGGAPISVLLVFSACAAAIGVSNCAADACGARIKV
jgi:hypothetical protein